MKALVSGRLSPEAPSPVIFWFRWSARQHRRARYAPPIFRSVRRRRWRLEPPSALTERRLSKIAHFSWLNQTSQLPIAAMAKGVAMSTTSIPATVALNPRQSEFSAAEQRPLDRVQHHVEILAHIFGKKAQHEIAVLLEQLILAAVSAIRIGTFQMLRAIQFDYNAR